MRKLLHIITFPSINLIVFLAINSCIYSQETVSCAGQQLNTNQAKINFTIGEPVIYELSTGSHRILNGYQQPILKIDTISIKETEIWNVSVFPNPSQDIVNIQWDNSLVNEMKYKLFSINGKLIIQGKNKDFIKLNISKISSGNYFLYLEDKNQKQVYKIEKIK